MKIEKIFRSNFFQSILSPSLPVIFICLIWLLFAAPYFLKGKVPYPSSYQVNHFHPWSTYETFWGPVKNGAMPDVIDQLYPWRYFTITELKSGHIPLWNPYSFSGTPHLANYQSATFSPLNFLFFIMPFIDAWSLLVLLQPLIAGICMAILMRELKVSIYGTLLSSISYMFCGFIVVWMAYGTLALAIAFLPLGIWAIERIFRFSSRIPLGILAIVVALSFFSGHFQTSLYFLIYLIAYICYKMIRTKKIRIGFLAFCIIIIGILLSLPQVFPSIEFYIHSVRSTIFLHNGGIDFRYLLTIFAPDYYGNPVTRNDWFGYYAEWASFIGIVPLFFSFFSVGGKNRSVAVFFLFAGLSALLLALNTPIQDFIGSLKIPVLSTSGANRIIVLASFSFALLSGFGFDHVKHLLEIKKIRSVIYISIGVSLVLSFVWFLTIIGVVVPIDKIALAKRNLIFPTLLYSLYLVLIVFRVVLFKINKLSSNTFFYITNALFILLVILAAFDSLRFAQKWMPFDSKSLVYPRLRVTQSMQSFSQGNNARVFGNVEAGIGTYYHFGTVEGYDPLYIQTYGEFIRTASAGELLEGERSVVNLDRRGKYTDRVLDFLGISLIMHPVGDTFQEWAYPVWDGAKKFSKVYDDNRYRIYKNNDALERVKIFYKYRISTDSQKTLHEFYDPNFDFRSSILLDQNPGIIFSDKNATGVAKITSYTPSKVIIDTSSTQDGILLLTDSYYPGWRVSVDGVKKTVLKANYAFRAVAVSSGIHQVIFEYSPMSFTVGVVGAIVGLVGLLLVVFKKSIKKFSNE